MDSGRQSSMLILLLLFHLVLSQSRVTNETTSTNTGIEDTNQYISTHTNITEYALKGKSTYANITEEEPMQNTTDEMMRSNRVSSEPPISKQSTQQTTDATSESDFTQGHVEEMSSSNRASASTGRQSQVTTDSVMITDTWTGIIVEEIKHEQNQMLCLDLNCECPDKNAVGKEIFLDCSGKSIRTLPDGITLPDTLRGITFQENEIRNIGEYSFVDAPKIEELDFAENKLEIIDENAFKYFSSLSKLRLSHNRLRKLPLSLLLGLDNLRVLEIDNNEITELTGSFFAPAKDLQEIRLQNNRLNALGQDTFKTLAKITKLDLSGNGLKALHPDLFGRTPLLNWLSLTDNSFQDVPRRALSKLQNLHSLDLSGNQFQILKKGSFPSMDSVSCLYLNNIQTLVRIEEFAFMNMTNLKTLQISFNKRLSYIHPHAFTSKEVGHLLPIDQLFLSENALERLPEPSETETGIWSKLSHADFTKNPWVCDCNMRWMKREHQEIFKTIRCESPLNMHGRSFATIQEAELECYDSWAISSIILGLSSVLVFAVFVGIFMAMIYSRSSISQYIRTKSQFMYSKVPPKTESVDLELDPSADV